MCVCVYVCSYQMMPLQGKGLTNFYLFIFLLSNGLIFLCLVCILILKIFFKNLFPHWKKMMCISPSYRDTAVRISICFYPIFFKYHFNFIFKFYLFIFGCFWSSLLREGFLQLQRGGLLFIAVRGLLTAVASLVVEHGLYACGLQQLWHVGSVVVACGLSCSVACGICPDQGSNPCSLHWQADS